MAEPGGRLQSSEALDNDWRSPPASSCHQEHGFPEVLEHGAVSVHPLCAAGCAHGGPGRSGPSPGQVRRPLINAPAHIVNLRLLILRNSP